MIFIYKTRKSEKVRIRETKKEREAGREREKERIIIWLLIGLTSAFFIHIFSENSLFCKEIYTYTKFMLWG